MKYYYNLFFIYFLFFSSFAAQNINITFNKADLYKSKNINLINKLIYELKKTKYGNWTESEFYKLFDNPLSQIVYTDILIKYARPDSRKHQEDEADRYLKIFMKEEKISKGVKFLKEYDKFLTEAEVKYNVHKKDIVSILMWESGLGEYTGNYQVFNVFINQILYLDEVEVLLAEKYRKENGKSYYSNQNSENEAKKRIERIRNSAISSLVSLLKETKLKKMNPFEQKGSWGGAIGYVQFMPFNLHYAVDGNNDGVIDLYSFPDAIHSCANFLLKVGKYNSTKLGREKAIYRYNPSNSYVKGVITYADTIWARYIKGE